MTHAEVEQLLGAYALDAVDGGERQEIEEHLTTCPRCRSEVTAHREAAAMLAQPGGDAPLSLWSRIEQELNPAPPDLRLEPTPVAATPRRRRRWVPTAAAFAVAAAVIVVLAVQVVHADSTIEELRAAQRDPLGRPFEMALNHPRSHRFELRTAGSVLRLPGAVTPEGRGFLDLDDLPPLPADQTYQLWGVLDGTRASLGVLGTNPEIVTFDPRLFSHYAITVEAAPGTTESLRPAIATGGVDREIEGLDSSQPR